MDTIINSCSWDIVVVGWDIVGTGWDRLGQVGT
jgi:hypothetical protein